MTQNYWNPGVEQMPLVRCMIRCITPLLESENPQAAQTVLACIHLLHPRCDTRKLQALTHYRMGQYIEAMAIYADLSDMESRALYALCQRAIGERSWLGVAREVKESGEVNAMAIIDPWLAMDMDPIASEKSSTPEPIGRTYFSLRA